MKLGEEAFPKGVLQMEASRRMFDLTRHAPCEALEPFVRHFWMVKWDLRGQAPHTQVVLSHPTVNLVFGEGQSGIFGISRKTSSKVLEGSGWVLGIKFKPGGFYPFYRLPVSRLNEQGVGLQDVFGETMLAVEQEVLASDNVLEAIAVVERYLTRSDVLPMRDEAMELVQRIVKEVEENREITRVDELERRFHLSIRTLQRLFDRYVGVSPKWVIQRSRLHEAAQGMESGNAEEWCQFSQRLGYFDQAHFIKDFKSVIGLSPEAYLRELGMEVSPSQPSMYAQ